MATFRRPIRIAAVAKLKQAWLASKDGTRSGRSGGVDGISPTMFRNRLDERLRDIREELVSLRYRFDALRPVFIPKKNTAYRVICIPTVKDRLVQRVILDHLLQHDKLRVVNRVSYGFQKGRSVQAAVKVACRLRNKKRWILKSDICSFFDSIGRAALKEQVNRLLRQSSISPLICAAIDCEVKCADQSDEVRLFKAGIVRGQGLRQGMPLSPILSNVILRDFDQTLEKRGISLVRYADDFVVLTETEEGCMAAYELVRRVLEDIGLSIPEPGLGTKTVIYPPSDPVEFLGLEITPRNGSYIIKAPQEAFAEANEIAKDFQDFALSYRNYRSFSKAMTSLTSKFEGLVNAYRIACNYSDLRSHYDNVRQNTVQKLLESVFGRDVMGRLDAQRRQFMDVLV